jgi:hypothetical protein
LVKAKANLLRSSCRCSRGIEIFAQGRRQDCSISSKKSENFAPKKPKAIFDTAKIVMPDFEPPDARFRGANGLPLMFARLILLDSAELKLYKAARARNRPSVKKGAPTCEPTTLAAFGKAPAVETFLSDVLRV